jgi:Terminase large subunit, T4likevirus-type, N-terminal
VGSLATDLAMALDPVQFSHAAGIAPDPWQCRVLRSTAPRLLLNCSRQSGKSTTVGTLALHTAIYQAPALILLLSLGQRQSGELFRKVTDAYKALGRPVPADAESALRLELENGSRIIALPGAEATVRGYSGARLLIVDEASRVLDNLYYGIRPMLAVSGGRLALLSTPFGKRGFFHKEWTEGTGWERYEVPASQCPRISPEFLAEERRTLAPFWYQQEYDCLFSETTDQLFSYEDVQASISADVAPLFT